jgi:hypothetical protein
MSGHFRVTFDTVTPESAENGESAAAGYVEESPVSLRDAISACRMWGPGGFEDSGRWFSPIDDHTDYQTGESTRYALHPPTNITAASYRRLARVLTGRER